MKLHYLIHLYLLALCLSCATAQGEIVVVVTANSPVDSLSNNEVRNIFLGKSNRFPDGSKAIPLNRTENSPERDAFYQLIVGRSPAEIKSYWSKMIFTGRGQPPQEADSSKSLKKLLAANASYISYMDSTAVDDTVKVLTIR